MPGNIQNAAPSGVMPASLCTAFTELREYVQLQNQYHDGTVQRSQLAQTSRRTFRLAKRLSASLLSALYSFWVSHNAGLTPFAFYNPFDVAAGQQIGSNYDSTGNNTQGRVTVVFRGNWAQATDIARTNVNANGGGSSIANSQINEFTGPYGLGINASCPNPISGAVITRLYRRGSNGPDTNTGTLWIVWAKVEQNFKVQ